MSVIASCIAAVAGALWVGVGTASMASTQGSGRAVVFADATAEAGIRFK